MECVIFRNDDGLLECRICQRPLRTKSPPERVHRKCRGVLNAIGQQLIKLKPGVGLALLIKYSGAKAAAEWAEFIEKDCPKCQDREARIEAGWQRLVWKFCASAPAPKMCAISGETTE